MYIAFFIFLFFYPAVSRAAAWIVESPACRRRSSSALEVPPFSRLTGAFSRASRIQEELEVGSFAFCKLLSYCKALCLLPLERYRPPNFLFLLFSPSPQLSDSLARRGVFLCLFPLGRGSTRISFPISFAFTIL
eukprot:GHVT01064553.1.p1 GENE.GHVT01064553.1~~GHVT01064553.1.p1  ORF type:complete len:134 (+),score=17.00 GHVT01064553.1:772-1173(+)